MGTTGKTLMSEYVHGDRARKEMTKKIPSSTRPRGREKEGSQHTEEKKRR